MVFHYDPATDMLYIELAPRPSVEEEVSLKVVLDFDEQGAGVGMEIEDATIG